VYYKSNFVVDTISLKTWSENTILFIGKRYTIFKSLDKMYNDSLIAEYAKVGSMLALDNSKNGVRPGASPTQITRFNANPLIINVYRYLMTNYLIKDDVRDIFKWKIDADTKIIGTFTVQKASCNFRGRSYEAWFCPDIPIPSGPWKFGGLPGLILEVYDSTGSVKYNFSGFENKESKASIMPKPPKDALEITYKQYLKLEDAFRADPIGFVNRANISAGVDTQVISIDGQKNPKAPKRPNNPIELEEY
jgi:GLPGLI family protein